MKDTPVSAECSRADARRNQILDAAANCFREGGFHGASIAAISRQAGMSAGHIYHYFDSKEAIIAAIVQRDMERLIVIWAQLRASHDVRETMVTLSANGVRDTMNPLAAGLSLEIIAEATRNPEVAQIVQTADRLCMDGLIEVLRLARQAGGKQDDEKTLAMMAEVVAAMFEGLMLRSIRNPAIDRENMVAMIQRVMRRIISSADWEG